MQNGDREADVTYIGPRSFVIGFAAFLGGFLLLLFGVDRITESSETRSPLPPLASQSMTIPTPAATLAPRPGGPRLPPNSVPIAFAARAGSGPQRLTGVTITIGAHVATVRALPVIAMPLSSPCPKFVKPATSKAVTAKAVTAKAATSKAVAALSMSVPVRTGRPVSHVRPLPAQPHISAPQHVRARVLPRVDTPTQPTATAQRNKEPVRAAVGLRAPQHIAAFVPTPTEAHPIRPERESRGLLVPLAGTSLRANSALDPRLSAHETLTIDPPSAAAPSETTISPRSH